MYRNTTQFINVDWVFDYFHMSAKKYCNRNSKKIKYILKAGQSDLLYKLIPYVLDILEKQNIKEYGLDKKHSIRIVLNQILINNRHMFEISADGFIFPNLNGSSVRQQTTVKRKLFCQNKTATKIKNEKALKKKSIRNYRNETKKYIYEAVPSSVCSLIIHSNGCTQTFISKENE